MSHNPPHLQSFPTRRSSDLLALVIHLADDAALLLDRVVRVGDGLLQLGGDGHRRRARRGRSEEHTSELQSRQYIVLCLILEKKKIVYHSTCLDCHSISTI